MVWGGRGRSTCRKRAHIVWVYIYMERSDGTHADTDTVVILEPRLNNLGTRPQERSSLGMVSLTDCAQSMQMSSIDKGLDYDRMVMLTCKLLFAAAKAIVDIGPHMPRQS